MNCDYENRYVGVAHTDLIIMELTHRLNHGCGSECAVNREFNEALAIQREEAKL